MSLPGPLCGVGGGGVLFDCLSSFLLPVFFLIASPLASSDLVSVSQRTIPLNTADINRGLASVSRGCYRAAVLRRDLNSTAAARLFTRQTLAAERRSARRCESREAGGFCYLEGRFE